MHVSSMSGMAMSCCMWALSARLVAYVRWSRTWGVYRACRFFAFVVHRFTPLAEEG